MSFLSELRRRNVFRMMVLYVVAAWLILQVAGVLIDLAKLPDWIGTATVGVLAVGFPIALIISWFYELTPEGVSLDKDVDSADSIPHVTGRRLDFIVISLLSAGLILFAYDKWWTSPPPERSIAVLAFENMSGDPDQEYFSDGISEELLNMLAQIPELRVISRGSSFSFKGKHVAIPEVARQLNVAHVLEGSVRRVGDQVRITAQLIDAQTDSHLWSQTYDRELGDIFAVQDEIATAISDALRVKLALVTDTSEKPHAIQTANTDAYDAYLRGRELVYRRGPDNMEEAVGHLERSVRLDNDYAPAHAQLAIAKTLLLGGYRGMPLEEMMPIITPHLDRAQALDPDSAEAHAGRALLVLSVDAESAVEHARRALASNPSYGDAMNWLQLALGGLGRYEEANAVVEQMLVKDPLSIVGRYNRAEWLSRTGKFEEAHEIADQFLAEDLDRGYVLHADTSLTQQGNIADGLSWALRGDDSNYTFQAFILAGEYGEARRVNARAAFVVDRAEGHFDTGIEVTRKALQRNPDHRRAIWDAAEFLYDAGRVDQALPLYERLLDFVAAGRPVPTSFVDLRSANETTMRLALARRRNGDEEGAQAVADIARQDHAALDAAGAKDQYQHRTEAMIAAFEHDPERAFAAIKSAIRLGLRDRQFLDDAIFEELWKQRRFVALRNDLHAILDLEHEKVLQLICVDNPAPDNWQPMPETCEGVER